MPVSTQVTQEVRGNMKGRVKCTPLQGAEYTDRRAGVTPQPRYKNLEEWFQDNFGPEVLGETENVEVVRTFYTHRPTRKSDIEIWYADGEFGFYEGLPKRVAEMDATHVTIEYAKKSGINPRVELYVKIEDMATGTRRPAYIHELIEAVIHDDDEWKDRLPKVLMKWELVFPKGETWATMRVAGYPDSPGPSRQSPWVDPSECAFSPAVPGS